MEAEGDDLSRPRNIDFTVVFSNKNSAEEFVRHLPALGNEVSVEEDESNRDFPLDVTVVRHMFPSHAEISSFEKLLQSAVLFPQTLERRRRTDAVPANPLIGIMLRREPFACIP